MTESALRLKTECGIACQRLARVTAKAIDVHEGDTVLLD